MLLLVIVSVGGCWTADGDGDENRRVIGDGLMPRGWRMGLFRRVVVVDVKQVTVRADIAAAAIIASNHRLIMVSLTMVDARARGAAGS